MRGLTDLLCPEACAGCGRMARGGLCRGCIEELPRLGPSLCGYCGRPCRRPAGECRDCRGRVLHFDLARQAAEYGPVLRKAISRFKYSGCRGLAVPLAGLVSELLDPHALEVDAVTWVPPSPERLRRTGIDHGGELARRVAEGLGRPAVGMTARIRPTLPQMKLDPAARRTNLAGAFRATLCPPARVLVVDDVFTTGSTASEVARALKSAGAARVVVLGAARSFTAAPPDL